MSRRTRNASRAFTLAEAALSAVLVGVLVVASLRALGAATVARYKTSETLRAQLLADDLLAEIMTRLYADPGGSVTLGRDAGELAASRASVNDADDYDGLTETPPRDTANNMMTGYDNWSRSVSVVWCPLANLTATSLTETGIKRITVSVTHNGVPVATATAIKADIR